MAPSTTAMLLSSLQKIGDLTESHPHGNTFNQMDLWKEPSTQ